MFSQVFIRSTTCLLNSTVCRCHFAIFAILPPFAAKCVSSACLTLRVHSTSRPLSHFAPISVPHGTLRCCRPLFRRNRDSSGPSWGRRRDFGAVAKRPSECFALHYVELP